MQSDSCTDRQLLHSCQMRSSCRAGGEAFVCNKGLTEAVSDLSRQLNTGLTTQITECWRTSIVLQCQSTSGIVDAPLHGRRYRKLGGKVPGSEVMQETAALEERLQNLSAALAARQARLDATVAACGELAARVAEAHDAGLDTAVQVLMHTA